VSAVRDRTSPRREDIDLTEHAVEQYRARSRPAHAGARADLARLAPSGEILSAPDWAPSVGTKPFYLMIGDTLALPLAAQNGRWVTTSCLVKTTLTERRREQRVRQKARRPSAKRARRRPSR
jgi:hypothetical protein